MQTDENSDSDTLDDFMDSLGIDVKPTSAEDALMIQMTGGGHNELHVYRYWLIQEIHIYHDLKVDNCLMKIKNNISDELKEFTFDDYIATITKYYLKMKYLPWFEKDMRGLGKVKMDDMVKLLVSHDIVRGLLASKYEELPKLRY